MVATMQKILSIHVMKFYPPLIYKFIGFPQKVIQNKHKTIFGHLKTQDTFSPKNLLKIK